MKIAVNKKPFVDEQDGYSSNYETNAVFTGSDESTADDLVYMMFDALLLDGYLPASIIRAMIRVASDKASWFDADINSILEEEEIIENIPLEDWGEQEPEGSIYE